MKNAVKNRSLFDALTARQKFPYLAKAVGENREQAGVDAVAVGMAKPGATGARFGLQSEYRPLKRVLLRHPRDAFRSQSSISRQWRQLNYIHEPDFSLALEEYEQFAGLLERLGAKIEYLESEDDLGLDSLYVRDASVVSSAGAILCTMGKQGKFPPPPLEDFSILTFALPRSSFSGAPSPGGGP